ncbi:hypothetical protein SAMN02910356_01281 [Selenomonas sp. GACV-9]|uniref:hypothetical protein n=1 Tax=Selenomonas sp. GACV-9 TaxID=3158782 RepID=UPI0008E1CB13|nr:hypothetical protein SAMN02910356_01281 [Selenomonas ruminantium]
MFKKVVSSILLAAALVFVAAPAVPVEAEDYYMGTYTDGTTAYLVSESIEITSRSPYTFNCLVRNSGNDLYYSFYPNNGSPYYRNSEGYHGYVFGGESPIAANIYRFVINNY